MFYRTFLQRVSAEHHILFHCALGLLKQCGTLTTAVTNACPTEDVVRSLMTLDQKGAAKIPVHTVSFAQLLFIDSTGVTH